MKSNIMIAAVRTAVRWLPIVVFTVPMFVFGEEETDISDPVPIVVDTGSFYLWRTATGGTMRVAWTFPLNATVANLSVTGREFTFVASGIMDEYVDIELPTPAEAKDEDVLDFTLSFNDGTVKTASLGLVRGRSDDGGVTTSTPCLSSSNQIAWRRADKTFVLPVPKGTKTLTVSGEAIETGLDGAAGWLALGPYAHGTLVPVAADDETRNIFAYGTAMMFIVR